MKNLDVDFKKELTLVCEIESQSDRGAAIIAAAWVEEALRAAVQSFLLKRKKSWDRLFNKESPLSSFSANIDIACLLGILDEDISCDLHMIRKIRNEFAHSILDRCGENALNFETGRIRDMCFEIKAAKHEQNSSPRVHFLRSCVILQTSLELFRMSGAEVENPYTIRLRLR